MLRVDKILWMFRERGRDAYFGESVSQAEHALQTAHLGEVAGVSDPLIVAALLHDVGHLFHDLGEGAADHGIDDRHERSGGAWLSLNFGPEVAEPVRLHVDAKRYLCAVEPSYLERLSPASRLSLELQGGSMNLDETRRFEANPYYLDAVRLRRWDDEAKIPGWNVPELEHYLDRIASTLRTGA